MAKKNTRSTKSKGKTQSTDNQPEVLDLIENSKDASSCKHSRGPACSVEPVVFKSTDPPHIELGLNKDDLLSALKNMLKSRMTDEKHLTLVKQGKSFFHIGGSGHEAVQTAIGIGLESGKDWFWTYYRDLALSYAAGLTTKEYFLLALGKADDPATGGRQMPNHYGHPVLNMPTQSSPTGTQFLNAVGTALASRKNGADEITYVASGEGTTSQGEFYEAINWASREKLPVMFCIQDNGYAISVPRENQSMGSTVGHSFCCYSNLRMKTFDGTDFFESLKAVKDSVEYLRAGKGPVLLHAMVERLLPHSSSDDQRKYRPKEELEEAKEKRDAITFLSNYMIKNNIIEEEEFDLLKREVKNEINDAVDWAMEQPDPKAEDATMHIFAPEETRKLAYTDNKEYSNDKIVLVDAVNHALHEEMKNNPKMLIFGEDVADPKGGVFTATRGLTQAFGEDRVFNSPLAEASIVGVALGLAVRGYKPVVEIQFGDYIWPAFHQYRNEVSTMRFRSNNGFAAPVVTRVAVGGYIHGGLCHSQNIEGFFSHIPGLFIAYPSTAADAKGLLKTAIRIQDPVLFLEHKGMYRLPYAAGPEPDENHLVPFGKGKILKEGSDATIITWGMSCRDSMNAVKKFERENGGSIEVIDLRTIVPWDKEMVLKSIAKTNRALIVHEDTMSMGFGAEISATLAREAFRDLDAPVMRVAAKDSHIPYSPNYESEVLPNEKKIKEELEKLMNF